MTAPICKKILSAEHSIPGLVVAAQPGPLHIDEEPWFGAFHANGTFGYVGDATLLRQERQKFLQTHRDNSTSIMQPADIFTTMEHFESKHRNGTWSSGTPLTMPAICSIPGGSGLEGLDGFLLLKDKMRVAINRNGNATSSHPPRLFCSMYTYGHNRDQTRSAALAWGYKCDGFIAFSTETIPNLGIIHLKHKGEEAYTNMWQKVRAIWAYTYEHYLNDYDYFHLGGDDMYVIPENLKLIATQVDQRSPPGEMIFLGHLHGENRGGKTVGTSCAL